MKVNKPVKQSETTVRFEVRMVHWSEVHLEASTEGNIVPSVAEYVLVQAVADGSVKIHNVSQLAHLRFMRLSKKILAIITPLRHSLTTPRSEVSESQVVESHFEASTLGRAVLPPYVPVQLDAWIVVVRK